MKYTTWLLPRDCYCTIATAEFCLLLFFLFFFFFFSPERPGLKVAQRLIRFVSCSETITGAMLVTPCINEALPSEVFGVIFEEHAKLEWVAPVIDG